MQDLNGKLESAEKYALYLLSLNDYTVNKLKSKLIDKQYEPQIVENIITKLVELKYLDDSRYAQTYIRLKKNQYGMYRMRRFLKSKGISDQDINRAINELEIYGDKPDELDAAKKIVEKKLIKLINTNEISEYKKLDYDSQNKLKQKLFYHLSQRGYGYSVAKEAINYVLAI